MLEKNSLNHSVKESEKTFLYPSKGNRVYSGLRAILHPSFVKIRSVVFVQSCWQTDKRIDKGENITSFFDGGD